MKGTKDKLIKKLKTLIDHYRIQLQRLNYLFGPTSKYLESEIASLEQQVEQEKKTDEAKLKDELIKFFAYFHASLDGAEEIVKEYLK